MKKNHTMRAASLLLVLTLITSCFVGGTFAKYTTQIAGSDTARVAQFGVTLAVDADLFDKEYDSPSAISVKSHDDADVIAPGTTGTATIFTIAGAPEVDVTVDITLNGKADATPFTMVTLPAGTYKDWTDLNSATGTYTLGADYKPVLWTLKKTVGGSTTTVVDAKNLNEVEAYLESLCGKYEVEGSDYANIVGTYELTWAWDFNTNDQADTTLGQIAATVEPAPATGYVANESFAFYMNVTQVD